MQSLRLIISISAISLCLYLPAQEQIGVASAVNKNTTDLTLEQERKLIDAGYQIIQNHTIETDSIGRAQMLLLDGTALSVGPNSSVVLDKFIYNPVTAEGSLEVTARGLLRIVGGKVTKKQPALIRTNSATVGIRGGIGIVQTIGSQTNATFLYGTEMTVTPNCVDLDSFGDQCSQDFTTTVTEPGFTVSVEDEDSEPSEPVEVTEESLDALQEELEAPEDEAPEDEAPADEAPADEAPADETPADEAPADEASATEETASEDSANAEAGDSTDIEVDEGLLDSSGVSDASSDVAPDELGTAEEFEIAIELETVEADDANEDSTESVTEEVAEVTQETTVEVAPIFQVSAIDPIESIAENIASETLTSLVFINPGELSYSVTISGEDAALVTFNEESLTINLISAVDYEEQQILSFVVTIESENSDISEIEVLLDVTNIDEPVELSSTLLANSFAESIALQSIILESTSIDPEAQSITFSLSGTGSENFSVDAAGNITLSSALDYETTTSYSLTLTASDGTNSTSNTLNISVDDVIELSIALASSSVSLAESVSSGTNVTATTTTTDGSTSVSYVLSGTGSDQFSVSSSGTITTAASLDYETTASYSLTLTASDGTNTVSENFTITLTDVNLSFSGSLAASSQSEALATGTTIATSSSSDAEGTVSYSLTDADNKFAIDSSTGAVTLANALDYETKTSHAFTITATDGTTTTAETFTLSVSNQGINTLAVTLPNSGAAIVDTSSSGTAVASSSINNPDSDTISYSLSGTGNGSFAVSSSGNVTTTAALDFEAAKAFNLTLTASGGGITTTDAFTVNVGNVEELESAVLRYSADYNSASRSGMSATATRGPSGSSLAAYTLEQVGTTNATDITSVDDTSNNYVPIEINSGTALNWRYYFPTDVSGNGQYAFAPNSSAIDGKYYSLIGTAVTTTIANADFITAGRLEGAEYWFMTTNKAAANISYTSALVLAGGALIVYDGAESFSITGWNTAISAAGLTNAVVSDHLPSDISSYSLIIDYRINVANKESSYSSEISTLTSWLENSDSTLVLLAGEQCCEAASMLAYANVLLASVGGGSIGSATRDSGILTQSFDISSSVVSTLFSDLSGDSWYCNGCGPKITHSSGSGVNITDYTAFWSDNQLGSDYTGNIFMSTDIEWQTSGAVSEDNQDLLNVLANLPNQTAARTSSTYYLYENQVTLAGEVYKDANFASFTNDNKRVIAMVVIPIENFSASGSSNDYFYPNFVPTNFWSYGDVGLDYCSGVGNNASICEDYENHYDFSSRALDTTDMIDTARFYGSTNELPEGQSLWWQILNPSGVGVGLWAQISFKDSYAGASGNTFRDDQQSLLNVVISNVDYRKNDTTRYSAGDTGLGMEGYHYWSYQGATNADNNGLGINYGTSPIECATSNDSGCFWGDTSNQPGGAMLTSSDPYKSGSMSLGVNYNSNTDTFSTGTFNASVVVQDFRISNSIYEDYANLSDFRVSAFYSSSSNYSGFFSGILEFDVSGTGNSQLASMRSSSTLATFTFDTTNDDLQVVAPMTISAAPSNNYTSNWSTVDTGSMTLKFGDATNDAAKSAYISHEVFGAEIQDNGAQIDGSSGGSNNLAGVMVSYNTLEKEDADLFHTGGNNSMPNTDYSTWGFWAMSAVDVSPNSGTQNASVHLGTWVGGETVNQSDIPTSGSASMSGAAVMNVAYRYNQSGTNYDVHKYTTTANVAATFNWGTSGYSGTLAFTNFDNKNPIVANAGFASFSAAITGTDHTYSGNSTDTIDNSWLGGASVAGALYGESSVRESGGRVNVSLYKSGVAGTAGANDFYLAEGIYLVD